MECSKAVFGLAGLLILACGSSKSDPILSAGGSTAGAGTSGSGAGTSGSGAGMSGAPASGSAGVSGTANGGLGGGGGANPGNGGSSDGGNVGTCSPPADVFSPIEILSQTGCVDPADPRKLSARAISYELNSPLWSDSSDKARAFLLPAAKKIHVRDCTLNPSDCPMGSSDDGRWDFPVGSVLIKNFMFDAKLVETRLLMHVNGDNWVGYSYQWNEQQTDAKIISPDRSSVMFNTGTRSVPWSYPSQQDCITCHTKAGGSALGPETAQMNRTVAGENQIDHFTALGLFDNPPTKPYKTPLVTPYPGQLGSPPASATLEEKARSYLHANCAYCHRPGGTFALFDLRYDTALKDTKVCNAVINKPPIPSAPDKTLDLSPGHHADSTIWLRMKELDPTAGRMPQIGTAIADSEGMSLVGAWIDSLTDADCNR